MFWLTTQCSPIVHELLRGLVLLGLAEALDDDGMEAGVGSHPLEEQGLGLDAELDPPEEVHGGAAGVAFLGVEQEPVAVLELLLGDVPALSYKD